MNRPERRMNAETVYRCTDGEEYTGADIWDRFESGEWRPCCWDVESGREWVCDRNDDLLMLWPWALDRSEDDGGR
jgi:hypothetical protein